MPELKKATGNGGQRRLPLHERRAAILAAARTVFAKMGYEQASMVDIANASGIVEGTIYIHFQNKLDLLTKVLETWYEEILSGYQAQLAGIEGTRNRLRFMIWYNLYSLHQNRDLCRLLVVHVRSHFNYRHTSFYEMNCRYSEDTLAIVQEGIAKGEFRADVPLDILRDMLFGAAEYHIGRYFRAVSDARALDQVADTIVELVCRAIAVEPSAAPVADTLSRLESLAASLDASSRRLAPRI